MASKALTFNSTPANNNWYGTGTPIKPNEQNYSLPADQRITSVSFSGKVQGAADRTFTFTLTTDTNGSNAVTIGTFTKTNAYTSAQNFSLSKTLSAANGNKFAGQKPHLKVTCTDTTGNVWGVVNMTVNTGNKYTAVVAGNPIKATDYTQTGKSATNPINATNTSGTAMSGVAYASTFNSQVLGL